MSFSDRINFIYKNNYFGGGWGIALIQVFNRKNNTNGEGLALSKEAVDRLFKEFKWFNRVESTTV